MTNRQIATRLINQQIQAICGLSLADLPDTPTVCNAIDSMEEHCAEAMNDELLSHYQELASEYACEILEEEGFPC